MNLHNEIMNIPIGSIQYDLFDHKIMAYKCGHRDARHAAAELALDHEKKEELISILFEELRARHADDMVDTLMIEYGYTQGEDA